MSCYQGWFDQPPNLVLSLSVVRIRLLLESLCHNGAYKLSLAIGPAERGKLETGDVFKHLQALAPRRDFGYGTFMEFTFGLIR